jgi:hypothetical protein
MDNIKIDLKEIGCEEDSTGAAEQVSASQGLSHEICLLVIAHINY